MRQGCSKFPRSSTQNWGFPNSCSSRQGSGIRQGGTRVGPRQGTTCRESATKRVSTTRFSEIGSTIEHDSNATTARVKQDSFTLRSGAAILGSVPRPNKPARRPITGGWVLSSQLVHWPTRILASGVRPTGQSGQYRCATIVRHVVCSKEPGSQGACCREARVANRCLGWIRFPTTEGSQYQFEVKNLRGKRTQWPW